MVSNVQISKWRRRLFVVAALAVALMVGRWTQEQLGIAFNLESLERFRSWVEGLGWLGPLVFVVLVVSRLFIGLSSHLILIVGGLAFGAVNGIIWGSIGLILSGLVLYLLAQMLGTAWVNRRFGAAYQSVLERIQRVGAVAIFAVTAHPIGVLTPAHLAGGLVGMSATHFAVAITLAAPLRAAPYAFLGTAALDMSAKQSLTIAVAMIAVFLLPLLSPRVRNWIMGPAAIDQVHSQDR